MFFLSIFRMLLVLTILLFSCSFAAYINTTGFLSRSKLRITGGSEAVPHAYPYQVAILIDKSEFCGGSLVSTNYVLTAAHCAVAAIGSSTVEVILGAHNISANEPSQVRRTISSKTIHPSFDDVTFQNDIALLRLSQSAPINDFIKVIPLLARSDSKKTFVKKIATSTGWGLIQDVPNPSINDMSSVLRVVNISVIDINVCKAYYDDGTVEYVTVKNICTSGDNKKGTCNGDSGGPLVLNGAQIGIVSSGATLCESGAPSVFTHIGKYLSWIGKNSDVIIT